MHPHTVNRYGRREGQVFETNGYKAGRNSQADGHVPEIGKIPNQQREGSNSVLMRQTGRWDARDEAHTIGYCGTGLGQIFTPRLAAVLLAFIVHTLLLLIQEMYCARKDIASTSIPLTWMQEKKVHTALSFSNPGLYSKPYTA